MTRTDFSIPLLDQVVEGMWIVVEIQFTQ